MKYLDNTFITIKTIYIFYMLFCNQSIIAILLCFISTMLDISLFGFHLGIVIFDIIVSIFFISLINWLCFLDGYSIFAWIITLIMFVIIVSGIFMIRNGKIIPDTNMNKKDTKKETTNTENPKK